MAQMIPSNMHNMTPGEKVAYGVFRDTFPVECIIRYEVLVGFKGRRPDFTIMDPVRGVCIVEVKDWGVSNITKLTKDQAWVKGMGGSPASIPIMNPDLKCQTYQGELYEMLASMPSLRDAKNKLRIPVEYFVVFPNIQRDEFVAAEYGLMISESQVIFKEDLENKGKNFFEKYQAKLPTLGTLLNHEQIQSITAVLDPTLILPKPVLEQGLISEKQSVVTTTQVITSLSLEQEDIAKSLGEGPRLLRGIAGTGKTMILLYRAKLLAANNPDMRILVLCWNTALANYMRQSFESFQLEAKGRVDILHFSEFLRKLLKLMNDPFQGKSENYENIRNWLDAYTPTRQEQYDAIYVDEAQDFRKEWIEFLFEKMVTGAEPKDRNFIIAADDAQRIYKRRDFSWDTLNFKFSGRSKILKTIYRNSARVWIFSAFLLEEKAAYVKESPDQLAFANQGKYEVLSVKCQDLDQQITSTVEMVKNLIEQGFAARNVLILYRHKTIPWLRHYPLIDNLRKSLELSKIKFDWIADGSGSKRTFNWEANTVKISTVHSAKGMDSPVVIILGVETFQPYRNLEEQDVDEVKLLYVAMTRAREFLAVFYSGKNGLVPNLNHCEKQYKKYRNAIITMQHQSES